jgi:predicted DNA repair protein MutK
MAVGETDNEAMVSTWYHYGVIGLIVGVGGTIVGIWQMADGTGSGLREMGAALVLLCPLMTVLALASLTIARRMRAELNQNNHTHAPHH